MLEQLQKIYNEITGTTDLISSPKTKMKDLPLTSLYVIDKYINLLPIGVKGELCIG